MGSRRTYQVHANGNADHGDLGLRVTITEYDETGHAVASQTWRAHVRDLDFTGLDWQAYSVIVEMARMMVKVTGSNADMPDALDAPLF